MDDMFDVQKMTDKFQEEKLTYEDEDDLTWEEKMMHKQISEHGFNMVNSILLALIDCFMRDMFP
jgi:hypothetical protein